MDMSKYDNNAATKLPLVESVIIIAIFALISVAIMRLYVAADKLQGRSVNISKAAIMAENRAEELAAGAGGIQGYDPRAKGGVLPSPESGYYDKSWNPCSETDAYFVMTTEVTGAEDGETGKLTDIRITVEVIGKEQLAQLETSYYTAY